VDLHIEQDLRQQGAEVLSVRTDVTKELACKELIEQAYARFGRIDALINSYAKALPIPDDAPVIITTLSRIV